MAVLNNQMVVAYTFIIFHHPVSTGNSSYDILTYVAWTSPHFGRLI